MQCYDVRVRSPTGKMIGEVILESNSAPGFIKESLRHQFIPVNDSWPVVIKGTSYTIEISPCGKFSPRRFSVDLLADATAFARECAEYCFDCVSHETF